jgi:hypothetical protein
MTPMLRTIAQYTSLDPQQVRLDALLAERYAPGRFPIIFHPKKRRTLISTSPSQGILISTCPREGQGRVI